MTEREVPQQSAKSFPKSLAELKLPTPQEAERAVREVEQMVKQMAEDRRRKSGPFDADSYFAPIGIGRVPSESVPPAIKR